jgi:hypothetical protein
MSLARGILGPLRLYVATCVGFPMLHLKGKTYHGKPFEQEVEVRSAVFGSTLEAEAWAREMASVLGLTQWKVKKMEVDDSADNLFMRVPILE